MNKNEKALNRFEQAHNAKIEKLFWIAGDVQNDDLVDIIKDMGEAQIKKLFPGIEVKKLLNDPMDTLFDFSKFGLFAEIHIPKATNFSYKEDGTPWHWSTGCVSRVEYVYAETLDDLLIEVEKVADATFQDFMKEDKKREQKNERQRV